MVLKWLIFILWVASSCTDMVLECLIFTVGGISILLDGLVKVKFQQGAILFKLFLGSMTSNFAVG